MCRVLHRVLQAARLPGFLVGNPAGLPQSTPDLVSKRGADMVRERRVLDALADHFLYGDFALKVRTEAGTYIKEMITGDGRRTLQFCTSILGRPCASMALDVLDVELSDPPRLM